MKTQTKVKVKIHSIVRTRDHNDVTELKGSKHRILFQNAEGNINMGVYFNDPDVEWSDIYWYNTLAEKIEEYKEKSDYGMISFDEELEAYSCCVELHRKGTIRTY